MPMTRSDLSYHDLIANNRRNSVLLVAGFIAFIVVLVGVMGSALAGGAPETAAVFGGIGLVLAIVAALTSYYSARRCR